MGKSSKVSKNAERNRGAYGERRVGVREELPKIWVFPDDRVTGPAYFKEVARTYRGKAAIMVFPAADSENSPGRVVARAIDEAGRAGPDEKADAVWAVLDCESTPSQCSAALEAKKQAGREGVKAALSMPSFEVWTLLHLEDTGATFQDAQAVTARVLKLWAEHIEPVGAGKSDLDYSKVRKRRKEAVRRAKAHAEKSPRDPSWTEVYLVIEDIDRLVDRAENPPAGA